MTRIRIKGVDQDGVEHWLRLGNLSNYFWAGETHASELTNSEAQHWVKELNIRNHYVEPDFRIDATIVKDNPQ